MSDPASTPKGGAPDASLPTTDSRLLADPAFVARMSDAADEHADRFELDEL